MLIKDVTFLKDSQPFNIDIREQKQVDLVLVKLLQPQHPKKIRTSFFFKNTSQIIFSLRHPQSCQLKCFEQIVSIKGKNILRKIICYGKFKPPVKEETLFEKAIYGTVRNPITKAPIFNVNILLYPLKCLKPVVTTFSNTSGHYLIDGIPASTYRIMASKLGYYTFRAQFTIESNQQFNAIDISLFPKPNLSCNVHSPDNRMEYRS